MLTAQIGNIPVYQFFNIRRTKGVKHFITTRQGGESTLPYQTFNLGIHSGESWDKVIANKGKICKELEIPYSKMVLPRQNHGANIGVIQMNEQGHFPATFSDTDALITNLPGICIGVVTADCVPILILDPIRKVIGAIHAGWKGTIQEICRHTITKMVSDFNCSPSDLIAGLGPAISKDHYQIGPEVAEKVHQILSHPKKVLHTDQKGGLFLDLCEANKIQLLQSGLLEEHIECSGLCTFSNPKLFYSVREQGSQTGRILSAIMLTP